MTAAVGLIALAVLALVSYTAHKVRRIYLQQYALQGIWQAEFREMYRQTEALFGLYAELNNDLSLPPTRGWAASPDLLLHLAQHAQKTQPTTIVECGSGVSTLVLSRCLSKAGRGHVLSLEHNPGFAQQTRDNLARAGLDDWATVVDAELVPYELGGQQYLWYSTKGLPSNLSIDLLLIDGPPSITGKNTRYPAGPVLFKYLSARGVVFLDDADRVEERETLSRWAGEFPNLEQQRLGLEKGLAVLATASPVAQAKTATV
jgi:predicted O-methyltransferase YrrM